MLNKGTLVLEGVTLAQVVELVVEVLVDLAGGTVLDEQTTEDTLAAHPDDLAVDNLSASVSPTVPFLLHLPPISILLLRRQDTSSSFHLGERLVIPGHTSVLGTLSLTETTVATLTAGLVQLPGARARVHGNGLADDEAIGDELADGLARVGVGDLAGLVRVEPDLALTAADNCGSQALLSTEVDPVDGVLSAICAMDDSMTFCLRRSGRGKIALMSAARCISSIATLSPDG